VEKQKKKKKRTSTISRTVFEKEKKNYLDLDYVD